MAEVRVKIGADIRDLQKGVRDAQKEVGSLSDTARRASGSLGGTAKSIEQIKQEAREAIKESQKLRESLDDAAKTGSVAGSVFKSILVADIVQKFASEIKEKIVGALFESARAAQEAGKQYRAAFDAVSDFSNLRAPAFVFESRGQIIDEAKRLQAELSRVNDRIESLGADSRIAANGVSILGIDIELLDSAGRKLKGIFSETQRANNLIIDQQKQQQARIQSQLDGLNEQLTALDDQARIAGERGETEIRTREEIERQKKALEEQLETSKKLEAIRARIFAVEGTRPIGSRGVVEERNRRIAAGVPDAPVNPGRIARDAKIEQEAKEAADFAFALRDLQKLLDGGFVNAVDGANIKLDIMRDRMEQLTLQGLTNTQTFKDLAKEYEALRGQIQAFNDQAFVASTLSDLAVDAAGSLVNVKLGFEDAQSAVDSLRQSVQGLIGDLARAALKAALLSGLSKGLALATGGSSLAFGGLFRGFLGIPALASGGIVNRPTLSLIGEAGPEAVVPLSKLSSVGGGRVQVEPFSVTVRGGDLVLAFQQARQQTARTVGNIPLR